MHNPNCPSYLPVSQRLQIVDWRSPIIRRSCTDFLTGPSACLPACLPTYLPACLPACLPTYLPTYLPACLPACYLPAYLPACLPTCLPTYLPTYLSTCLPACLPIYVLVSDLIRGRGQPDRRL